MKCFQAAVPAILLATVPASIGCSSIAPRVDYDASLTGFSAVEETQRRPVWCWAACASMIHRFHGRPETQESIAARIHKRREGGELEIAAASRYEVYRALSYDSTRCSFGDVWEGISREVEREAARLADAQAAGGATTTGVDVNADPMVAVHVGLDRYLPFRAAPLEALRRGEPGVVGLQGDGGGNDGHLCVIVGAKWRGAPGWALSVDNVGRGLLQLFGLVSKSDVDNWDRNTAVALEASSRINVDDSPIEWVEIVDPWLEDDPQTEVNEMRRRLTGEEFRRRVAFIATEEDARMVLARWEGLVSIEAEIKEKGQ